MEGPPNVTSVLANIAGDVARYASPGIGSGIAFRAQQREWQS